MTNRSILSIALAIAAAASPALAQTTNETPAVIPAAGTTTAAVEAATTADDGTTPPTPAIDDWVPQTRSERLGNYLRSTFGPAAMVETVPRAALGQLRNDPREWGRGSSGFAARLASGFGFHLVRGTLEHGTAALLHEDNRYQRYSGHSFLSRSRHALLASFLTRRDNGTYGFGISKISSAGGAAFLSRLWMPSRVATVGAGFSSFGITIAADVGTNFLREFWPDLKKKLGRK